MLWQQKISSTLWRLTSIIAKDNGKNAHVGSRTTGPRKELHMESIWFKISMPAPFWRGLRQMNKEKELLSGGNGVQSVRAVPGQADVLGAPMTTWGSAAVPGGPTFCSVHSQSPKGFSRVSGSTRQDRSATKSSAVLGYTCVNELVILICREIYMCALAARRRSSTNPLFSEIRL